MVQGNSKAIYTSVTGIWTSPSHSPESKATPSPREAVIRHSGAKDEVWWSSDNKFIKNKKAHLIQICPATYSRSSSLALSATAVFTVTWNTWIIIAGDESWGSGYDWKVFSSFLSKNPCFYKPKGNTSGEEYDQENTCNCALWISPPGYNIQTWSSAPASWART